jgi:excisionase family DNA binding protein
MVRVSLNCGEMRGFMLNRPIDLNPEHFITLGELAENLGVPLFAVRRAARRGEFPTYRLGNRRCRVRLSEVITAIEKMSRSPVAALE